MERLPRGGPLLVGVWKRVFAVEQPLWGDTRDGFSGMGSKLAAALDRNFTPDRIG